MTAGGSGNGSYAFQLAQTSQTNLTLGTPYQGTLAGSGQALLFVVNIPTVEPLVVDFQDNTSSDQDEVYLKYGALPTRSEYDYRDSKLAAANQQVTVPSAPPGTWYILLYADLATSGSTYTITANSGSSLLGVTPTASGNSADVVLTLSGTGFSSQSTVSLVGPDGTTYPLSDATDVTTTEMMATIPANTVPAGTYAVEVTQSDGTVDSLANAFTMIQGGKAVLKASLVLPSAVPDHGLSTLYVQYSNTGDAPMPAPVLVVSASIDGQPVLTFPWMPPRSYRLSGPPLNRSVSAARSRSWPVEARLVFFSRESRRPCQCITLVCRTCIWT